MADARLETLARAVLDRRAEYEAAHKKKVKAEKAKKAAEFDLHVALEKSKQKGTTLELGEGYGTFEFRREKKTSASVFDKAAAIEYFKAHDMLDGYVEGTVRKAPINQLVREFDETGQELPPGIEPRITKFVSVTKR